MKKKSAPNATLVALSESQVSGVHPGHRTPTALQGPDILEARKLFIRQRATPLRA